jgi:hypothetical protein
MIRLGLGGVGYQLIARPEDEVLGTTCLVGEPSKKAALINWLFLPAL